MRRALGLVLVLSLTGAHGCERVAVASSVATESAGVPRVPSFHAVQCPKAGKRACVDRWRGVALRAGWSASSWPWLRCIIWRESGGNPRAWNRGDGGRVAGSKGLTQILWIHVPWMVRAGIIRSSNDLFDPVANLRAAKALYKLQGRRAWASTTKGC